MNSNCQGILRRVEGNDTSLTQLTLGDSYDWQFRSSDRDDFTRLGAAIGNNTHLTEMIVFPGGITSDVDEEFYDGLKRNSSIHTLTLHGGNIAGGACQKILELFQEKKNLSNLTIYDGNLLNGGADIIATTFRRCTNICIITMQNCSITGEHFLPMVEAFRGYQMLKQLYLANNNIGNVGLMHWLRCWQTLLAIYAMFLSIIIISALKVQL